MPNAFLKCAQEDTPLDPPPRTLGAKKVDTFPISPSSALTVQHVPVIVDS